ncbi:MAG: hypothetical protein IPH45_20780 [Bacteroidales bacterium]|nr:hypothetical protein [Bacteroidales bacterium]
MLQENQRNIGNPGRDGYFKTKPGCSGRGLSQHSSAPGDSMIITTIREASSYSDNRASEYLRNMNYSFNYQDTLLTLNPYFTFPKPEGMHHQSIELILGIPVNTIIILDEHIIWRMNIRNYDNSYDEGGEYIMTTSGLKLKNPPLPVPADSTQQE